MEDKVALLIPMLNPDQKFITLLEDLSGEGFRNIVVVDDGSPLHCEPLFQKAEQEFGCTVLKNVCNMGKGYSLKRGLQHACEQFEDVSAIVTIDGDGQHIPTDIRAVSKAALDFEDKLIMGCRDFSDKELVPFRSRFGNLVTCSIMRLACGITLSDTQTGLRGIPKSAVEKMIQIEGDRFEYETNVLLHCKDMGLDIHEVTIQTVYIEENKTSHFNPLKDSWKIYSKIFAYQLKKRKKVSS